MKTCPAQDLPAVGFALAKHAGHFAAVVGLAVIAVVTLPITALSSIYGMNIIVNDRTHIPQLIGVLFVMAVMSALLLTWAKRRGWW